MDHAGKSPFGRWFNSLSAAAAAKVTSALVRLEGGNLSALKPVGKGRCGYRIDSGRGYRVYIGQHGGELIILLGGSAKARQQQAIADAQVAWLDYRRQARREQ